MFYKTTQNNENSVFALKEHLNTFLKVIPRKLEAQHQKNGLDHHSGSDLCEFQNTAGNAYASLEDKRESANNRQHTERKLTRTVSSRA